MRKLKVFRHILTRWHTPVPTILLPAVKSLQVGLLEGEDDKNTPARFNSWKQEREEADCLPPAMAHRDLTGQFFQAPATYNMSF